MPQLKNIRHEKLAQLIASGKSRTDALREAGYKSKVGNASAIIKPHICVRIEELLKESQNNNLITKEECLKILADQARKSLSEATRRKAIQVIASLQGWAKEVIDLNTHRQLDNLSDEELGVWLKQEDKDQKEV